MAKTGRRVVDLSRQAKSTNKVTVNTCMKDQMDYQSFINSKVIKIMKEDPKFPTEYLPTAKFEPKMLKMRKKEGENPIHVTMLWTTK